MPPHPNTQSAKIRVLIVDDSALIRKLLTEILQADSEIEVVGAAADPIVARDKIKELNPDVLTLDIEMPRMDGLTFLEKLMRLRPTPVVMVSSLTETGADTTLQALEYGAIDYVTKPKVDIAYTLQDYAEEICGKVKIAARAKVQPLTATKMLTPKYSADAVLKKTQAPRFATTQKLIAIGASTGGTEAIKTVLEQMPADAPGIVITQHIPEIFSASFARRMNQYSAMTVKEAEHGEQILQGHAYVAPGNRHLLVLRDGARFRCALDDGPPVNRHRPSVDVLFRSVAQAAGFNAVGVILTGMGDDGARGLSELHSTGAATFAQDEKTCVVWGMPAVAVQMGGVDKELPIQDIAEAVLKEIKRKKP